MWSASSAAGGSAQETGTVSARPSGPVVRTPDGVPLHTEVDERTDDPRSTYGTDDGPLPPDAPTLVLVHGYALSLDCWHFQRKHFRGKVRIVLYDQRSHGRSERSAKENVNIDQLGDDLAAVLEQLVPEQGHPGAR